MDEFHGTYYDDDEYADNHDYDDTDDDTDDDNDHEQDSYTAAGAAPDVGAAPTRTSPYWTRPGQARYFMITLFWPERASYKSCEALDITIRK